MQQKIEHDSDYTKLKQTCIELSIHLSEVQGKKLLDYIGQLLKWNHTYNLTSIRDPNQALIQHIFDSLAIVPGLQHYFSKVNLTNPSILDVGSGAGLPGIVIAIMFENAVVTCVDPVEKKISFIRQMAGVLKLKNLNATQSRVENLNQNDWDLATSRAFASLEDFAKLTGPRIKEHGVLLAMKGKEPLDEIMVMQQNTEWQVEQIEQLKVPQLNAKRCLLWIKRKGTR